MKEVFRLPGWRDAAGCCWRCSATNATMRCCGADAQWRQERRDLWDLHVRWQEQGLQPSPVLGSPFFQMRVFQIDWLHCMDLGVACDFLGNVLTLLLKHMPGNSRMEQVRQLYLKMVEYYNRTGTQSRLDTLTLEMLAKPRQPPKLRARAGEARALVSFAREQTALHFADEDPEEATAKQAAEHLEKCYSCLSAASFDHGVLAENSRKFCVLFAALESWANAHDILRWRFKPKHHLMQELCDMSTHNPASNWTYRDEDFGGSMAAFAHRRGGKSNARVAGMNVLRKFMARHDVPAVC